MQRRSAFGFARTNPPHPATVVAQRSSKSDEKEKEKDDSSIPLPPPPMEQFVPVERGKSEYEAALITGANRALTLQRGPQDTINPGPSQETWNRYKANYVHTIDVNGTVVTITTTFRGRESGDERYENYFDFATGTITASHNVRSKAEDKNKHLALSGSEVLFRQIIFAEDAIGQAFIMRVLKRKSVINGPAQALITYLRKKVGSQEIGFTPRAPGFVALLGTQNGTAATWLVHDHGFYLGVRGIRGAEITAQGHILFHFVPGPMGR